MTIEITLRAALLFAAAVALLLALPLLHWGARASIDPMADSVGLRRTGLGVVLSAAAVALAFMAGASS